MSCRINSKVLFSFFLLFSSIFVSSEVFATTQLCFKKEVSADGVNWFDANTEAEAVIIVDTAYYRFSAFKCPETWGGMYNIVVEDPMLSIYQPLADLPRGLDNSEMSVFEYEASNICVGYEGTIENIASVEGWSMVSDTPRYASDTAWLRCDDTFIGGDGCTPGYWKQPHHIDSWPVEPETLFSEVFGEEITIKLKKLGLVSNPTLLEALKAQGGKVNTAARHAVAAYLNSLSSDVNYDLNVDAIIAAFNGSYQSNNYGSLIESLVNFNEQGCPLN